jgi:hypothetical protein
LSCPKWWAARAFSTGNGADAPAAEFYLTVATDGFSVIKGTEMAWRESEMAEREDPFRLERFVEAQEPVYEQVCAELREGRKRSHWIWFIFRN